jgi:transposase
MMGQQNSQKDLFTYHVDLDRRVRPDHPLRRIAAAVDFTFVRQEVAYTYGHNGNVSVDPAVILKMMFLLFYDNVSSERQLLRIIPERLDYLWFLGYGLEDEIPDHSVLSKARTRWGSEVFEKLFVRTVAACVRADLVDGSKLHMDGSLIKAHASTDAVLNGPPELIAALRAAYREQEGKLDELAVGGTVNQTHLNTTDPDAQLARSRSTVSRPSYKQHRAVDDAYGVITAQATTGAAVKEDTQLPALVQQHQAHCGGKVQTAVADSQYGTAQNFVYCHDQGITAHMADLKTAQNKARERGEFFGEDQFAYDPATDTYLCPAGQRLRRLQYRPHKHAWRYAAGAKACAACALRSQCTRAKGGRLIHRIDQKAKVEAGRLQACSPQAVSDRKRRRHLMEGSFADAANNHGFKKSRWRRLWRQRIQNSLIAACQNVRILLRWGATRGTEAIGAVAVRFGTACKRFFQTLVRRWSNYNLDIALQCP